MKSASGKTHGLRYRKTCSAGTVPAQAKTFGACVRNIYSERVRFLPCGRRTADGSTSKWTVMRTQLPAGMSTEYIPDAFPAVGSLFQTYLI